MLPRRVVNAFPAVEFVPFDGYSARGRRGDEGPGTLLVHYAGAFAGARLARLCLVVCLVVCLCVCLFVGLFCLFVAPPLFKLSLF